MSKTTGRRFPFGLGVLVAAAVMLIGVAARADVTTEQGGSILIFPKVLNLNGRDTVIQISNTGNTLVHAHCFYTDAQPVNPLLPASQTNPPVWQETDFWIWLTKQQPTHWLVSAGRGINPFDSFGSDGNGIDPGLVPPVVSGFEGDLACVEVGADGLPVSGNKLKGEATLISTGTPAGDVSKYSALAIEGGAEAGATGRTLRLDNNQYNSCPNVLLLDHFTYGVEDPVVGSPNNLGTCEPGTGGVTGCPINTELTLVPCARDYENQIPASATIHFDIYNEFEQHFSTDTAFTCWFNQPLNRIGSGTVFTPNTLGTLTAYTRVEPTGSSGGVLGIAEETHTNGTFVSRAAFNLQTEDSRLDRAAEPPRDVVDTIVLTGE